MLPRRRGADVDAVAVRRADGKVPLEGERHDHEDGETHGYLAEAAKDLFHGLQEDWKEGRREGRIVS